MERTHYEIAQLYSMVLLAEILLRFVAYRSMSCFMWAI